jgi:hypothetical protein
MMVPQVRQVYREPLEFKDSQVLLEFKDLKVLQVPLVYRALKEPPVQVD